MWCNMKQIRNNKCKNIIQYQGRDGANSKLDGGVTCLHVAGLHDVALQISSRLHHKLDEWCAMVAHVHVAWLPVYV